MRWRSEPPPLGAAQQARQQGRGRGWGRDRPTNTPPSSTTLGGTESDGLIPDLPAHGVISEPLNVFDQAIRVQRLDNLHDPGMQRPPPFLQQAAVGYFMGEGVLERIFQLRKRTRLVEEFSRLQSRQPLSYCHLGQPCEGFQ